MKPRRLAVVVHFPNCGAAFLLRSNSNAAAKCRIDITRNGAHASRFSAAYVAYLESPSFSALQNFDRAPIYYAFDLPTLSGDDLMKRTLDQRRKALRKLTRQLVDPIRFSETFDTSPGELIAVVREQGLEGIVAKRLDSFYEPGKRSGAWVKLRVNRRQNFIIGGYMPRGANFDSILVGYYEGRDLKYAASVRAGFTPASRREVFARCSKLEAPECPFSNLPDATKGRWGAGITAEKMAQCCWLKPRTVVAIDFLEWTLDDRLRHPSFVALSTEISAKDISREG